MGKQKKRNKNILSIDYDDDQKNLNEFNNFLIKHTERQKNKTASEIFEMGDQLLSEIEHKKKIKEEEKKSLIKYILKKSDKYSKKYLSDLDFYDVKDIHKKIKCENRSLFKKFFDFLFSM